MLVTHFQGPVSALDQEEPRLDIMDGASSAAFQFQCLLEDFQATGTGFSEFQCSTDELDKYVDCIDKVTRPAEMVPFNTQCSISLKDIMSMYDYRSEFPQIKDVYVPDLENFKDTVLLRPENPMLSSSCVAEEAPTSPTSLSMVGSTWKEMDNDDLAFGVARPEYQNAAEHIPTIVASVIESSSRVAKDATTDEPLIIHEIRPEYHSAAQEAVMQKQGEPCRRKLQAKRQKRVEKGLKQTASSPVHQSSPQQAHTSSSPVHQSSPQLGPMQKSCRLQQPSPQHTQARGSLLRQSSPLHTESFSTASSSQGVASVHFPGNVFQPDHDYSKRVESVTDGQPQNIIVVHESNGVLGRTMPAQVNVLTVSSAQTNRGNPKKRGHDSGAEDRSSPEKGAKRGRRDLREKEKKKGRDAEKKLEHSLREAQRRRVTKELYDRLKQTLIRSLAPTDTEVQRWSKQKMSDIAELRIVNLEAEVKACAKRTRATLHRVLSLCKCSCTCDQCKFNFKNIDADLLRVHEEIVAALKPYSY